MSDTPPVIPDLPPAPIRNQAPADFSRIASNFVGALNPWGQAVKALGQWVADAAQAMINDLAASEQARDEAHDHADEAATHATSAGHFADLAAANANFKGNWSDLSGALNVPASVRHNGAYWQLLRNLPNVAASEPGEGNADWATAEGSMKFPPAGIPLSTGADWGESVPLPEGGLVGVDANQELTSKTLGAATKEAVAEADVIAINDDSAPFQQIALTAPQTATISLSVGVSRSIWINRGTHTVTWPAGLVWVGGGAAPELPESKWSLITFTGRPGSAAGTAALVVSEP